jgi:hypothetical protein
MQEYRCEDFVLQSECSCILNFNSSEKTLKAGGRLIVPKK